MAIVASMNKAVMKFKLSIVEDEGTMPTHFGFMSFGQVKNLCVLEPNVFLSGPLIFKTMRGTPLVNTSPHTLDDAYKFHIVALPLHFGFRPRLEGVPLVLPFGTWSTC